MPFIAPSEPYPAVVAPEGDATAQSAVGTVVLDQHQENIKLLHSQLRTMTLMDVAAGHRLRIACHIADGMWSSVYSVCEADTGCSSALKVIPIVGTSMDSVYADVELLRQLSHPNIVEYYSHFVCHILDLRCLCIQVELCNRGTLSNYIRTKAAAKKPLSAARVEDFVAQLASALAYVHNQGFLHGDLRPHNVLLTGQKTKQLKLTGFGSPLWLERKGLVSRTITGGCKAYAPPEWMNSELPRRKLQAWETPLPSYDMWSLGCVLSELVTLKLICRDRRYLRSALASDPIGLQGVAREVAAVHGGVFSGLLGRLLDPDADTRITAPEVHDVLSPKALRPRRSLATVLLRPFSNLKVVPPASPRE
eukprot:EG_transcript_6901